MMLLNSALLFAQQPFESYKKSIGLSLKKSAGIQLEEYEIVHDEQENAEVFIKEGRGIFKLYIRRTSGRAHKFVFCVLIDNQNKIRDIQILEYPSDYGIGATNKKWLAKFTGKTPGTLIYRKNVDAVSGSTISATSIVETINKLPLK